MTQNPHACPSLETWCAYVDGTLDEREKQPLDLHRRDCDQCFSTLETLRRELHAAQTMSTDTTPPELLAQATPRPIARKRWYYAAAAVLVASVSASLLIYGPTPSPPATTEDLFVEASYDEPEIGFASVRKNVDSIGQLQALLVYAQFKNEAAKGTAIPDFADDLFDPDKTGSFAHFYDTMSFGQLQVRGTVVERRYTSRRPDRAYLSRVEGEDGLYGEFVLEILEAMDDEVDFARFDNDGPDGLPNSGDDDGLVDYLFVNTRSTPRNFIRGGATGIGGLGFEGDYETADLGHDGAPIRVSPVLGAVLRAENYTKTVGTMAHEFGHALGVPDLYDLLYANPAEDSAGIGKWGLMAWGTHGWNGNDGPNPFCAWSREKLGWLGKNNEQLVEIRDDQNDLSIADLHQGGTVYKIPLQRRFKTTGLFVEEYLLLEYRAQSAQHYNRNHPADGLLIWHIRPSFENNLLEESKTVDLICADGLYTDAGAADPFNGFDQLDFWAHDADYTQAHNGNMGDASDPFDGERFTRLAADTNPSVNFHHYQHPASSGLQIEIRRRGDAVQVSVRQPRWSGTIEDEFHLLDPIIVDGDLVVAPGAKLIVHSTAGIYFEEGDRRAAGQDPALSELQVDGQLVLAHSPLMQQFSRWSWRGMQRIQPQPVYFRALQPGATWYGIVSSPNAQLDIPDHSLIIEDTMTRSPGMGPLSDPIPTAIDEDRSTTPETLQLLPNYPNPFNSQTTIPFVLPKLAQVRLAIYNSVGQIVRVLIDEERQPGRYEAVWDGRNERGQTAASGVYLYLLEIPGVSVERRKMTLVQ